MKCLKCNSENMNTSQYCYNCGTFLLKQSTPTQKDDSKYYAILGLLLPSSSLGYNILNKVFIALNKGDYHYNIYSDNTFQILSLAMYIIPLIVSIMIGIKIRNTPLKIFIIVFASLMAILPALNNFHIISFWGDFWFGN